MHVNTSYKNSGGDDVIFLVHPKIKYRRNEYPYILKEQIKKALLTLYQLISTNLLVWYDSMILNKLELIYSAILVSTALDFLHLIFGNRLV